MKLNKDYALGILEVVEQFAGITGIDYPTLHREYGSRCFVWDNYETYCLELLINGGFLTKREGQSPMPDSFQLTWKGHELIDSLRIEFGIE